MQVGIRIKSKDINSDNSTIYLAKKLIIDIFTIIQKLNSRGIKKNYLFVWYIYLLLNWKSLQVSHRQAHDDLVNSDSDVNQPSTS